jgi:N-acetylglucosaminyl-diphospho-decaprenol L-rhamnosyltransferase
MDLSILIVNWNSADYLEKCLRSLYATVDGLTFETIVVDNASFDGSDRLVREKFPSAVFVQNEVNSGFAAANNLAFRHSSGKNLLFLNPDTEPVGSAIRTLWKSLEATPGAGAVGCQLFNPDQSIQPGSVHKFPTILNQALDVDYRRFFVRRAGTMIPDFTYDEALPEVQAVSGACIMARRDVFEKIGLFSTDYFMYSEDLDLCYKIRQAGYRIYHVPHAAVIHHGGASSKKQDDACLGVLLMRESVFKFLEKFRGRKYALTYKWSMVPTSMGRLMMILSVFPLAVLLGKEGEFWALFRKWIKILNWSLGMEPREDFRTGKRRRAG